MNSLQMKVGNSSYSFQNTAIYSKTSIKDTLQTSVVLASLILPSCVGLDRNHVAITFITFNKEGDDLTSKKLLRAMIYY